MDFSLHPYILHALPKSLSLIRSPESYLVKSTDREVLSMQFSRVSCCFLSQMCSSAPCFRNSQPEFFP
jgi:hypothetical protein